MNGRRDPSRFGGGADSVFFTERERGLATGRRRSLARAAALASRLGLADALAGVRAASTITVVGSKGKGTAATYASAALSAAGLRVGTLTSPGLRSNRERIRIDGRALGADAYDSLVRTVAATLKRCADALPDDGYLSPTGLFTLAAVRHFVDAGCDAWVLEAGMGGAHDEVSLFPAGTVIVTPVFGEHLGILGNTVFDIATEKLGVAGARVERVLSTPQQHPEAAAALEAASQSLPIAVPVGEPIGAEWPAGLGAANAMLGVHGAMALLRAQRTDVAMDVLASTLATVRLPARMSTHRRGGQAWTVDAGANGAAVSAALAHTRTATTSSAVLWCVPDGKDVDGVREALVGERAIALRTDALHLTFSWAGSPLPSLAEIDTQALGSSILAVGTVHFAGDVLDTLDVDTEVAFRPPAQRLSRGGGSS